MEVDEEMAMNEPGSSPEPLDNGLPSDPESEYEEEELEAAFEGEQSDSSYDSEASNESKYQ